MFSYDVVNRNHPRWVLGIIEKACLLGVRGMVLGLGLGLGLGLRLGLGLGLGLEG